MWENTTSYSKSDDKTKIRTTKLKIDCLAITVTKHIHWGDELIMYCENVGISQKGLGLTDMAEGQKKALDIVENRLKKMVHAIDQVITI